MRAVLKGKTQEFIQGGITPSGLATQVRRGIIKGFDATTYRATVQLLGSLSVWLEGVPVAKHIGNNLLSSGARCGVLFFDESNPSDACVAFVYDGAPGPWITSGLVVDGAITAADCLSNVAGGLATIDASGDLNPPNHVRAAGRFYPGGQGTRYMYDAGAASGLAVAGGPLSSTGYIYPGTGSALQTTGYITADASGNLAALGGNFGVGALPSWDFHVQKGAPDAVTATVENTYGSGDTRARIFVKANGNKYLDFEVYGSTHSTSAGKHYLYAVDEFGIQTYGTDALWKLGFYQDRSGHVGIKTTAPGESGYSSNYGILTIKGAASRYQGILFLQSMSPLAGDAAGHIIAVSGTTRVARIEFGTVGAVNTGVLNFYVSTAGTEGSRKAFLADSGNFHTYGYIYPGTGSGVQMDRYIRDDGDRLLAYGGFKIDVSSGDTPLVFQRAGAYKWTNYVYATYDDLRWGARIGSSWYDRMVLDDGSGNLYIDGTYNTFSPVPPKENMTPEDYLAWALEDASKPPKPYPGVPKEPAEVERYGKDISKIAIGVARYVDHLRSQVATLEARLAQAGL